jgi:hypothetical protein
MAKDISPSPGGRSVERSASREIDDFLRLAKTAIARRSEPKGRIVLALDATMSRQPTWDMACRVQGEMFDAAGKSGELEVQLAYFRGFGECRSSKFVRDTGSLKDLMVKIDCRAGHTQIGKILAHALKESAREKINALVYIGDAMEEEIDQLAEQAGALGLRGVPVFVFQEGDNSAAETAFREIARLSKGAWFRFDRGAAARLAKLLSSVAVYATGGLTALEARNLPEDRLLLEHMRASR